MLYDLLLSAILEIRSISESTVEEEDRQFINLLAHQIHNWPERLRDARGEADHEALLRHVWEHRDRRSESWLRDRLTFFGRNPDDF